MTRTALTQLHPPPRMWCQRGCANNCASAQETIGRPRSRGRNATAAINNLASRRDRVCFCHDLHHVMLQVMECRILPLLRRGSTEINAVFVNIVNDLPLIKRELAHQRSGEHRITHALFRHRGIAL